MNVDETRSESLLFYPDEPRADYRGRPFHHTGLPSLPRRYAQAIAFRRGRVSWAETVAEPLTVAREAALGDAAGGAPRVLLRIDEFPHAAGFDLHGRFATDNFRRFHAVLAEAGVPYLLAITPRISRDYLDPAVSESRPLDDGEVETMRQLTTEGVVFALHGADHRTRQANPRRHSEFCGLDPRAAAERIDRALATFAELGLATPVFVPPFNRFDAGQYDLLAERFAVVCGGPESIRLLGFAPGPVWRGDAVYLPSYPPLYGTAAQVAPEVERLADRGAAIWAPTTLHWGWELGDDFAALAKLARLISKCARGWGDFLAAVEATRPRVRSISPLPPGSSRAS
jgi:peptidoglycan/xylan/chitin deacetylase (PgdA/CDA1 family)